MFDNLFKSPVAIVMALAILGLIGYLAYKQFSPFQDMAEFKNSANNKPAPTAGLTEAEEEIMDEAMEVAKEGYQNPPPVDYNEMASESMPTSGPSALESQGDMGMNQLPSECYPKDVLNSADLLPRDANSLWAQVAPNGQGALSDQNFLTAGYHIGINTVGQTLRNANRQLRSEPPNPQAKVSPWNQTTIEPDINRRPLEIGGSL